MKTLAKEIEANYRAFTSSWHTEQARVDTSLVAHDEQFQLCYRRLVSLQAWRTELLEGSVSRDALGFFLEAQNDGLVSLVLAQMGSCRAALQSLRSCVENSMSMGFYMDHPVEMQLWLSGKHRLSFSQLESYFLAHPKLDGIDERIHGVTTLREEFGTLSRAVHGSAASFRMSGAETGTLLWSEDPARLGKYMTSSKRVLAAINQLLLCLFKDQLQGAAKLNLRKSISFAIPSSHHRAIRTAISVSLLS